jgi:hypothetical protein
MSIICPQVPAFFWETIPLSKRISFKNICKNPPGIFPDGSAYPELPHSRPYRTVSQRFRVRVRAKPDFLFSVAGEHVGNEDL